MNVLIWRRWRVTYGNGDVDVFHKARINGHQMGSVLERRGRYESSWENVNYSTLAEAKLGVRARAEHLIPWAFARPQRRPLP